MGSKPKMPKPPKVDIEKDIMQFVSGYSKSLPTVLGAEQQFRPQFQALNLADVQQFGMGLLGLSPQFTQQTGQQLGEARAAELGQMTGQTGLTRGLMQAISPEQAFATQQAQQEAERAYAAAQGVTPQEQRSYQQQAREAFQASGRLGGNANIVSEAMGREDVLARKRAEAQAAGARSFDMANQFYTAPGLGMLGSAPLSYQQGQSVMGLGLGAIGAGVPQMINPDMGANLGAQERSNQMAYQAALAQSKASRRSGIMGAIGSIGGGLAQGIGAAGGFSAFFPSDKRLKTDIKKVGKTEGGLPIYTYKYKGDNRTQMGVMAQDVEKKTPKAVREVGGFKAVDYKLVK
jgi:hypothetical protein